MNTIKELKKEREDLSDRILKRSMIEMLLELYADKAEISIKAPDIRDKYSDYIVDIYIPLGSDEINKIMEEI